MTEAVGRATAWDYASAVLSRGVHIGRRTLTAILIAVNLAGIVVLLAFFATERIDDRLDYAPRETTPGGLASIDLAVGLIEREVEEHPWVANEPVFMPGHWLTNMQEYQQGMIYGISRFAYEFADVLGRSRGATAVDPDLDRAAGLLRFPGNVWIFDFEKTWTPTITSEEQYLAAARALRSYNARVATGEAVFDPRPDNLYAAISRIEADISSKANLLVEHVERVAAGLAPGEHANDLFFNTKGSLYAYAILLKGLERDFGDVIEREGLELVWSRLMASLGNAASMNPLLIADGEPGSLLVPSHIAELGFFTLRVKTQLRDVMAVMRQS